MGMDDEMGVYMWWGHVLAEGGLDQLTKLGAAGIMGAMWLWERRTSRQREQQIDESHARILGDRVQLALTLQRKTTYGAAFVGAEEPCKPLSFG